jgi:hypothetical protein
LSFIDGHRDITKGADTLNTLAGKKNSKVGLEVSYDLREDRDLYTFFTSALLYQKLERTKTRVQAEGWLRKQGHDPYTTTSAAVLVTEKEITTLNKLLAKRDILPLMPGYQGFMLLIPFFSSYASVGSILVIRPGSAEPRFINLGPEKFMWGGLLEASAPADRCLVTQNFALLMRLCSSKRFTVTSTPVCLKYNNRGAESKLMPNDSVYLHYPELEDNMAAVSTLFELTSGNRIQDFNKGVSPSQQKSWSRYIVEFITQKIAIADDVDNVLLHYIDSCKLSFSDKEQLLNNVLFAGYPAKAGQLRQHFSTRIIHISDKHQVRQAPAGYFAQEQKSGARTEITNFTLGVERNIVFPEKREIVTECKAQFGASSALVHIPTSQLDNPLKVEECVRVAWLSSAGEGDSMLPMVKDKNLYRKYLSLHLKEEAGRVASLEGISALGWNHTRTRFIGPGWCADAAGIKKTNSVLHREQEFLTLFKEGVVAHSTKVEDSLPIEIRDAVAMFCSNLLRGGLSLKNHPVAYRNTAESRKLLGALFGGLGQTAPFCPLSNRVAEVSGCKGYPFFAGEVSSSLYRQPLPMFYLNNDMGEEGLFLDDEEEGYLPSLIAGMYRLIFQRFFMGNFASFRPVKSVDIHNTLKQEGAQILTQVLGKRWEVTKNPFDDTDKFLAGVPISDLSSVFLLDIVNQGITVETGKNGLSEAVVSKIANKVTLQEATGGKYRFNMVEMSDMLSAYYQSTSLQFGRVQSGSV